MSDDAKKVVLARRAKFVAAALAGMTIACGKERTPAPCLDVAPSEDASTAAPQPCLSAWHPPSGLTTATTDERDAESPRPCLSVRPPTPKAHPKPRPTDCDHNIDPQGKTRYRPECL